jgi:hypothetical protein
MKRYVKKLIASANITKNKKSQFLSSCMGLKRISSILIDKVCKGNRKLNSKKLKIEKVQV